MSQQFVSNKGGPKNTFYGPAVLLLISFISYSFANIWKFQ